MELPYIDEHRVAVSAPVDEVWRALVAPGAGHRATRAFVALVGAEPRSVAGDPLVAGSTVPGFKVAEAQPGSRLVLAGQHRFSTYTLTFVLDDSARGTVLRAQTHAAFPGLGGRLYRLAVIRTGAHRVLTSALLRRIRGRAEATQS